MTCILALENASLDDVVEVSSYAASMPDVQLNIREGEQYRLEDLLYSLMLESHNDTAAAIAEHVAGTREAFADMMNQKARDIGCRDTFFITPNGLDAEDPDTGRIHSTTAAELAGILRYCLFQSPEREAFLRVTRAPSHAFSDVSGTRTFSCVNHNADNHEGGHFREDRLHSRGRLLLRGSRKKGRENVHRSASGLRMAASQNIQMGGHGKASGLWG